MSSLQFRSYSHLPFFNFPITVANHFPGRWIGHRGPIECRQRNSGLAACDFFYGVGQKSLLIETKYT
jgi:hypothetical protein